ncbi:MAG: serine/threonine-protein phosphatase [Solobacterium sp.]|nr:serine/threonine-protein phosphatase [Solobacterium sp.]MCH4222818.1 serine/threonine-protein phosphatase [Solobacterium sp.]MCH4266289.1 serine/threonine-protein phosphatase [Solobacterium sp.]
MPEIPKTMDSSDSKIYIDAHWRSLNKENEELCGDRVQIRRSDKCLVLVLADGLGSGVKANILSTLTSTIISEMIFAGDSLEDAVETIASTLPVCQERGIAYSTFTIIQVYYTGEAYIAEFDNPSVIIMRDQQVLKLQKETKQVNGKKISITRFDVQPQDFIVTFSDGVLHAGVGMELNFGWGQDEVEEFLVEHVKPADPAREVTRLLLANVNYLYGGKPGDDSTVACLKIVKALETRVMVGPPSKAEDDEKVVGRLLSATGKKVCCGGTTSEIVARVTNRELTTDCSELLADVPPKGFIDGIDLVTEGVLTLQKVSRYLDKAARDSAYAESLMLSKEEDGATSLARVLLESDAITFMVGLSDNPAHDAIAYSPISLNAKIALINEMAANLKTIGKIIHIEMY